MPHRSFVRRRAAELVQREARYRLPPNIRAFLVGAATGIAIACALLWSIDLE